MNCAEYFAHWTEIRAGLISIIDRFDEAQLGFSPFVGSWSAAEINLHIAGAEDGWFRHVTNKELDEWPTHYTIENYPTREAIKSALAQVHANTEAFLATLELSDLENRIETPWAESKSLGWIIWHVLEHEVDHRGELSLILGILANQGSVE